MNVRCPLGYESHGSLWPPLIALLRRHPPRREVGPLSEGVEGPLRGLVSVARRARIGDLVFVGHRGRDEGKRMTTDFDIGNRSGNVRHVTGDAGVPGTLGAMVRVRFGRHPGSRLAPRPVALQ